MVDFANASLCVVPCVMPCVMPCVVRRVSMFLRGPSGQILPPLVDMVRERWQLEGSDGEKNERETSSSTETEKDDHNEDAEE